MSWREMYIREKCPGGESFKPRGCNRHKYDTDGCTACVEIQSQARGAYREREDVVSWLDGMGAHEMSKQIEGGAHEGHHSMAQEYEMSTKDLDKKFTHLCIKMGLEPNAWETMTAREFLEKLKREHELRGMK